MWIAPFLFGVVVYGLLHAYNEPQRGIDSPFWLIIHSLNYKRLWHMRFKDGF